MTLSVDEAIEIAEGYGLLPVVEARTAVEAYEHRDIEPAPNKRARWEHSFMLPSELRSEFEQIAETTSDAQREYRYTGRQPRDKKGRFASTGGLGGASLTGPRPGMGDIGIDDERAAEMQHGSAAAHLQKNADGSYSFTEERQRLHDQIINDALEGKTRVDDPQFNILGGGPGSGKTTLVNSGRVGSISDKNSVLVNVDEVRTQLPEYKSMVAAGDLSASSFTHGESSYIGARLQAASFEHGYNTTLDGTGDSSPRKLNSKIDAARAAGYSVNGVYVTIPTNEAVSRAQARAERTGRAVPEDYLRTTHSAVSTTYEASYTNFDTSQVWDMTSREPRLLQSYDGSTSTVADQSGWDAFLAKGSE